MNRLRKKKKKNLICCTAPSALKPSLPQFTMMSGFSDPSHVLDVLPRVGGQMQHPKVLVVVELFSVWAGELPTKHPELTAALGNNHGLGTEGGAGTHRKTCWADVPKIGLIFFITAT